MMRFGTIPLALLVFILGIVFEMDSAFAADRPQPQSGIFATPLTDAVIDDSSLAEWFDGSEHLLADAKLLRQVVWTQTTMPSTSHMFPYGVSNQPGIRHLRIGFHSPIAIGAILARASDQISVLRPNAPYPGNMADDSQWIPAQRIVNRQVSTAEAGTNDYALWVLPSVTHTRALRITHIAGLTDASYGGTLGGIYLLSSRLANLAPQAKVETSSNESAASALIDEKYSVAKPWDNGPQFSYAVSSAHPEWIVLSWPRSVPLSGLAALWAGFSAAEVEVFTGRQDTSLQEAPENDWQPIGEPWKLHLQYLLQLGIDWFDFGKTVETRAIRLRITQAVAEAQVHMQGVTHNGDRVWLGQLMAITPLGSSDLKSAILPTTVVTLPHPPIPIHFTLQSPGYVSLVIDDAQGNRVRNLISDTWFPAGSNTAWWDGTDDLGRNPDAAQHGVYLIPTHFIDPGRYQVRGIYHQAIDLHYEFAAYSPGNPPWETADGTGGWLTNHTPASSALFLPPDKAPSGKPLVYLGCYISEGGSGLAWVDLDGNKQGGRGWVGASWTAAQFLARDAGPRANPDIYAYAAATWGDKLTTAKTNQAVLRLTGLTNHGDKSVLSYTTDVGLAPPGQQGSLWPLMIGGLAVQNNVAIVSLFLRNELLFADGTTGKIFGTVPIDSPRGLAIDSEGRLLVLSDKRLLRYRLPEQIDATHPPQLSAPEVVVGQDLNNPSSLTTDSTGNFYVSDQGDSNQVKIFSAAGKFLRAIGHPGPSKAGPYDPLHMNNPRGMAIDSNNHLWVAEEDLQPKRVSVWTLDGKLWKAFYGPSEYGGGGSLDPTDKTKFYYHAMEFKLDWKTGTSTIASVLQRPSKDDIPMPKFATPESVVYSNGHRYFDNTYLAYPSNGVSIAMLYLDTGGIIRPVAALGKANDWDVLKGDAFKARWPEVPNTPGKRPTDQLLFTWSDTNKNGKVDPEEVTFLRAVSGSVTVMPDLAMIDSFVDGKAMRYAPVRFTPEGIPVYDLRSGEVIVDGAQPRSSDGGGQALYSPQATVLTTAPAPFSRDGMGGVDGQGHRWSYPSLWPGLHPGHSAPIADHPGELEATTRLLGGFIHPAGEDAGPLWGINSNNGEMYLFTADGFFVTQLFQDVRVGKPWSVPRAQRNMLVNDLSPHDENFFPSLTQTSDGNVYVDNGNHTALVRVDGLNSLRLLPSTTLEITRGDLDEAQAYLKQTETARQSQLGPQLFNIGIHSGSAPALGDLIQSLQAAQWATIDQRIIKFGWNDRPDVAQAAVTIAGGRLFAAFRTSEPNLLRNSGAVANAPFKTGGGLDLMIGTDPHGDPKRTKPVAGDIRLFVYQVNGKTKALLYRAVVPGTANPIPFSSPWRTITLDSVEDVSSDIELQSMKDGDDAGSFAFSIPLKVLGLNPVPGEKIKADIGILRGTGTQTTQRVYWSNKSTSITSDVPSEAELTPNLWGEWIFKSVP
jgi:hypothetical protein